MGSTLQIMIKYNCCSTNLEEEIYNDDGEPKSQPIKSHPILRDKNDKLIDAEDSFTTTIPCNY